MKVLVTGANGLLGSEVVRCLRDYRMEVHGVDRADFDLRDAKAVRRAVETARPDAIVHCGAYTDAARAETEPALCSEINGMGTLNVVRAALAVDAKLLYVSTGEVFPGEGQAPYDASDRPAARTVYGMSKAQGEEAIRSLMTRYFILRTSWLYGLMDDRVSQWCRLAAEGRTIVADNAVVASPTWVADVARLIAEMLRTERYGVYHGVSEGACTAMAFAQALVRALGSRSAVRPEDTGRKPVNGRLSSRGLEQAGFLRLPPWEESLNRCLMERV